MKNGMDKICLLKWLDPFSDMWEMIDNRYWAMNHFMAHAFYAEAFDIIDSESLEEEFNYLFN